MVHRLRAAAFLDPPESFSPKIFDSFTTHSPEYTVQESMVGGKPNAPNGWLTIDTTDSAGGNLGIVAVIPVDLASSAQPHHEAADALAHTNVMTVRASRRRIGSPWDPRRF